jgi:hypothetical protein
MRGRAEERLHTGKLVLVKVEHHDFIERIEISGDYSLHPPEAMREVEKALIGVEVESDEEGIAELIEDTLKEHHAVLSGVTPEDIAKAVKKALG